MSSTSSNFYRHQTFLGDVSLDIWALRLAGPREFGFVGLYDFAEAAKLARVAGSHGMADAMAKVPSGFHAAAKGALKLARRDAKLGINDEQRSALAVQGMAGKRLMYRDSFVG